MLAVLALACRPERAALPGAGAAQPAPPSDTAAMDTASDSLALELVLPRQIRRGESVPITLQVQNRSRRTLDLYLRGRTPTVDVVVARQSGEVVWRRLEKEIIPAILHLRPLAPGECLDIGTVWDQRTSQGVKVEAGEYLARGVLLVEGDQLETSWVPLHLVE